MTSGQLTTVLRVLLLCLFGSGTVMAAEVPWLYEDGGAATTGVILCHGKGGDPEFYVVEPLRLGLNEELGYHTVSLQMPGGKKALAEYEEDFPVAFQAIDEAAAFLRRKGVKTIFLVAHSLGSRMATAYLAQTPDPEIQGFVGVGMLNNGGSPFNCLENLRGLRIPVLDIWGAAGGAGDNRYGLERRVLLSPLYSQKVIAGGDHALSEDEDELVATVVQWMKLQMNNR